MMGHDHFRVSLRVERIDPEHLGKIKLFTQLILS